MMRRAFLAAIAAAVLTTAAAIAQPPSPGIPPLPGPPPVNLAALRAEAVAGLQQPAPAPPVAVPFKPLPPKPAPNVAGGQVVLVPRAQLRAGPGTKTARLHPVVRAAADSKAIPVPVTWDWTKGDSIPLPILGNDQYGDCFYAAMCHIVQSLAGCTGATAVTFVTADVVKRYKQLSGGDNGLSDSDVFPEFKKGVVGPNGPHKVLDLMIVPATDTTALNLTSWAFGPQMFTFTVYANFMNVGPGTVLDGSSGAEEGGHAVVFSGRDPQGRWRLQTWGIRPSVLVTDKWVRGVDPEFIACFSLEWFDAKGYAPNGLHYNDLAALWNSMGGSVPAVGPFPAPTPGPTPVPPVPPIPPTPVPVPPAPGQGFTGSLNYVNGVLVSVTTGATPGPVPAPNAGLKAELEGAGVSPAIIVDVLKLVADVKAKAGFAVIVADLMQLIADLHANPTGYHRTRPDPFAPFTLAA